MSNSIIKFFKKLTKAINLSKILLISIVILGLFLRWQKIDQLVWEQEGNDESRDMLVAEHIVNYQEEVLRGPLAAGGLDWLLNSPLYFYLIAAIWSITKDPLALMKVWATLMSLIPLIGYYIGKEIKNNQLGLIIALMLAINIELIHESKQLLQPFLLPFFSTLFLWSLLKIEQQINYFYLSAAIFFLLVQLHFHYGVLLILPAGLILLGNYWLKLLKRDCSLINLAVPFLTASSIGVLWLLLTFRETVGDQFGFFLLNYSEKSDSIFTKLQEIGMGIVQMTFSWEVLFLAVPTLITLLTAAFFIKDKQIDKTIKTISLLAGSVLLMIFSNGAIANTYLLATLPYFIILISIGLYKLIQLNSLLGLIFLIIIPIKIYGLNQYLTRSLIPETSFYKQKEIVAQQIYDDYFQTNQYKQPNFALASINFELPFDGWGTTAFWFHLEKMTNKKLTTLVNYGVNVKPLVNKADKIYLVCELRNSIKKNETKEKCLNLFIRARNYLEPGHPTLIFDSPNYAVWRFEIIEGTYQKNYNSVYPKALRFY
ncbi:MAG: hypothetical protein ACOZAK_03850 [Patescibacteria group bacterium]